LATQALAQAELGLGKAAVQLGRLLEQRDRVGALVLAAQALRLPPVAERQVGVHLHRLVELVPGLLVLPAAQPHLSHAPAPGRVALGRGLLERLDGVVETPLLERARSILEVVGDHRRREPRQDRGRQHERQQPGGAQAVLAGSSRGVQVAPS
jgi:hypothetical protein